MGGALGAKGCHEIDVLPTSNWQRARPVRKFGVPGSRVNFEHHRTVQTMFAIKQARKFIENHPDDPQVGILTSLILSLQTDQPFPLASLYELDGKNFDLALQIVGEWRMDRHYAKKQKLLNVVHRLADEKPSGT